MKKFFSLFCALSVVLSVIAAPVSKKDFADKKVVKNELRQQQTRKKTAQAVPFKSAEKKVAPKVFEKKTALNQFNAAKAVKANVAKAPQVKNEATDVEIASWNVQDWSTDGEFYFYGVGNAINFYFDLYYGDDADDLIPGKEYTVEDIYVSASTGEQYAAVYYDSEWHYGVKELSLIKTIDEEGLVHFEGSVLDSLDGEWTFHFDEQPAPVYPEGGEFECDEASFSYYSSDGDAWYKLTVAEPEMTFRFDVKVGEGLEDVKLDSTYTLDDMIANYTYVLLGENKLTFTEVSFLKSSNEDGSADLNVVATDENGNVWKLHYAFPAAPEAEKFETITANVTYTKEAYWFWYIYTFEAADEANAIALQIMPDDSFYGTWSAGEKGDITGAVTPLNGLESEIYSGEVTIEQTAEGFKITGKVLCWNSTEYTLDLTYVIPEATREADFVLADLELAVLEGAWQLMGYNEDSTVFASIAAYADEVSGTYTESELAADYCILGNEDGDFEMLKANLEVTFNEADSTILITGTYRGQNGEDIPEFNVTLSGRIPTPEVSDMTFEFADEEEGIRVTPSNDDDAWDWYVVDEATFEYNGADYIAEVIYGKYGNTYAVTGEQLLSFEGDLANYLTASGTYYLVVWGAGEREITTEAFVHEFEFEGGLPEGCTQYDAEEGNDFIVNFAEFKIDDQYVAEHSIYIIGATDAQGNYVSLQIYAPEGLALGEYPVLEDSEEPFVVSGELDLSQGDIYGSFAGKLNASGQITVPLWLLVDGTVTITENSVIVDATNCAGAKIQCKMGAAQGIDNVDADKVATKSIKNGQLIIRKNGVDYNAQGAIVK